MSISLASASTSITALRSIRTTPKRRKRSRQARVIGDFSHFGDAVRKDMEFLKKRISKGIGWANQTFRLPQVSKTLDEVLWLRNLEDPRAAELEPCDWPQPSYPGLVSFIFNLISVLFVQICILLIVAHVLLFISFHMLNCLFVY